MLNQLNRLNCLGLSRARGGGSKLLPQTKDYIAYVNGDGGTVLDAKSVNDDIAFLIENGIWNSIYQMCVSYGGVKLDNRGGVNFITKLYDIKGTLALPGKDPAQGTDTMQPILNSDFTMSFPRNEDHLIVDYGEDIEQPYQRLSVVKTRPGSTEIGACYDGGSGSTKRALFFCWNAAGTRSYQATMFGGITRVASDDTFTAPAVYFVSFDGNTSRIMRNGAFVTEGSVGTNAADGITVGNRYSGLPSGGFPYNYTGKLQIVAQLTSPLTDAKRQLFEAYLATKFGITLEV